MPNDDVILEAVLATAIVAHAGNVPLLLPVLRAQCRGLVGEPDVVIRVFRLVAIIAEDPRYRPAFDQQKSRDTISAPVTTSPSYTARNYRPRWPVIPELIRSLKARLMDLGRRCVAYTATCYRRLRTRAIRAREIWGTTASPAPPIVDPGATCVEDLTESEGPTIIPTAARMGECGYTMEIRVTCVDGFLQDASGAARGICPWCLGKA